MDLEFVNDPEDGLVAIDRETGEQQPLPMKEIDVQKTHSESINTEQGHIAKNNTGYSGRLSERKLVSEKDRTITVGTDTDTIQEALNQIPLLLRHTLHIDIPDGDYSDEDLLVPPFRIADTAGIDADIEEGASQNPWIQGNINDPTQVKVNSITLSSTHGSIAPIMEGMQIVGETPYNDESAAVVPFGCKDVSFRHLSFVGCSASWAFMPYSSNVTLRGGIDFGSDDVKVGVRPKHSSMVHIDDGHGGPLTGTVQEDVLVNQDGSVIVYENVDATGGWGFIDNRDGMAYDAGKGEYQPAHGAEAYSTSSHQSIASDSETKVEFNATSYDRKGYFDTQGYYYLIPRDGRYQIDASVQFLSPSEGTQLKIQVYEQTTPKVAAEGYAFGVVDGGNQTTTVSETIEFSKSQEVAIRVQQDEGSSVDINNDWQKATYFSINRIN